MLDPCHRDTRVSDAAARLGCAVEYHPGFRASPDQFPPSYRGQHVVDLARSLGPVLDPEVVATAARSGCHDPQHVKQVWHCLARFGRSSPT